jgi:hypothetical protein
MHNPLRSEAEMFRVVVIVGVAAAPVVALGLIAGPEWGAILLAVEVGIGIGLAWRSFRGTEPHTAEVARSTDEVRRVLVVANETVGGRALLEEIRSRSAGGPIEVMVGSSISPTTSIRRSRRPASGSRRRSGRSQPRASPPAGTSAITTIRTSRSRTRCGPSRPTR